MYVLSRIILEITLEGENVSPLKFKHRINFDGFAKIYFLISWFRRGITSCCGSGYGGCGCRGGSGVSCIR